MLPGLRTEAVNTHGIIDFANEDGTRTALTFGEPTHILATNSLDEVDDVLRAAQALADSGAWVLGMVSYEAAPSFDKALEVRDGCALPLAHFGVFDRPTREGLSEAFDATELHLQSDVDEACYLRNVELLRDAIARGEAYQVNYTLRMRASFKGCAQALYWQLRAAQPDGYCAYLDLGRYKLVSASPELFFRRDGQHVTTRPMKGTRPRGRHPAEDEGLARELEASAKDRAENLMIVDLLRNDLSRLACSHGVSVPERFVVERHPTVWQMTSTVTARIQAGLGVADIFRALFPCGSVTGAPKIKAMELIAAHETSAREVYCGALGFLRPGGDSVFNVPIRTVIVDERDQVATCGLGSGIIWDSAAADEYQEVLVKSRFLRRVPRPFQLLETLRLEDGKFARLELHLARLRASARYFGFPVDVERCHHELALVADQAPVGLARVRLLLNSRGDVSANRSAFPLMDCSAPQRFALATNPISRNNHWLFHKTTQRDVYDRALADRPDVFDVLLWNEEGELTEFTRGNLVLEVNGALLTPALDGGLLDGCLRREWLEQGRLREACLDRHSLAMASRIWFVNSLRGAIEMKWQEEPASEAGKPLDLRGSHATKQVLTPPSWPAGRSR